MLLGGFIAFALALCQITIDERFTGNPWAWLLLLPVLFIAFAAIRDEFRLVDNKRAIAFTLVMFVSGLVSIITTLHFLGGAS